jgi:hypothetical protein
VEGKAESSWILAMGLEVTDGHNRKGCLYLKCCILYPDFSAQPWMAEAARLDVTVRGIRIAWAEKKERIISAAEILLFIYIHSNVTV